MFFLRKGAVTDWAQPETIGAFFHGIEKGDVHVCTVVPVAGYLSQVRLEETRKRPARPKPIKTFAAYVVVDGCRHPLPVDATGYMKARDEIVKFAEVFAATWPGRDADFHIRNESVPLGQSIDDLVDEGAPSGERLMSITHEGNEVVFTFHNEFNPKYKPRQFEHDRGVFSERYLARVVKEIRAEFPAWVKEMASFKSKKSRDAHTAQAAAPAPKDSTKAASPPPPGARPQAPGPLPKSGPLGIEALRKKVAQIRGNAPHPKEREREQWYHEGRTYEVDEDGPVFYEAAPKSDEKKELRLDESKGWTFDRGTEFKVIKTFAPTKKMKIRLVKKLKVEGKSVNASTSINKGVVHRVSVGDEELYVIDDDPHAEYM